VGGRDDRTPLRSKVGEERVEQLLARAVDARERLVEEQDRRVLDERARDEHALALAAGEVAEPRVGEVGEADPVERGVGEDALAPARRAPPRDPRERAHERDVERADRIVEPRALRLRHITEAARRPDRPRERRQLAEQEPEEGRLPAAVRPEHREPLAAAQVEAHVAEDRLASVPGRDVLHDEHAVVSRRRAGLGERAHAPPGSAQRTLPAVRPATIELAFAASIPRYVAPAEPLGPSESP
jgi:hypothetical protein